MADTRLSSSISSLRQKLLDQIPSANPEQLKRIARSARNLGHTQDTDIEDAINTRANTLIVTADATESEAIAAAINQVDDSINPNITASGTTATAAGTNIVTSDAAPGNPEDGDLWFKTDEMNLYIYYDDGTSSQWIQSNAPTVSGGSGDISDLTDSTGLLGSGGATVYADMAALIAATGMSNGDFALVGATNKLYVYYGAWFLVSNLTNSPPTSITGNAATYQLAKDGTPTVITLASTDPEGFPITWSHSVTTGSLGSTATVSQNNNVFTVTPSSTEADAGSFTLTFTANDGANQITTTSDFVLQFLPDPAGVLFTTVGTHTWTVPAGVTSVNVVVIGGGANGKDGGGTPGGGGGALAWKNNISVVPGNTYNVVVGAGSVQDTGALHNQTTVGGYSLFKDASTVYATGGQIHDSATAQNVGDRYYVGDGGGLGGEPAQGGGGAGGYSGNGGTGGVQNDIGSNGSGGGGGGGGGRNSANYYIAGGGGGVGVYGQGTSGQGGGSGSPGSGGSGGQGGHAGYAISGQGYGGDGGLYGGGGAAGQNQASPAMGGDGANGAVRIIWGEGRAFPSTNVDSASSTSGETTI